MLTTSFPLALVINSVAGVKTKGRSRRDTFGHQMELMVWNTAQTLVCSIRLVYDKQPGTVDNQIIIKGHRTECIINPGVTDKLLVRLCNSTELTNRLDQWRVQSSVIEHHQDFYRRKKTGQKKLILLLAFIYLKKKEKSGSQSRNKQVVLRSKDGGKKRNVSTSRNLLFFRCILLWQSRQLLLCLSPLPILTLLSFFERKHGR